MRTSSSLAALAMAMLAARVIRTGSLDLVFLAWNLALATVPAVLDPLARRALERGRPLLGAALGIAWWLFLPNAIYLVTDLVYVGGGRGALRWYDAAMLAAFAFAGAALAIGSLERMRGVIARRGGEAASWAFAATVWLTSGVGVWLGRVRRWNSWDVLLAPHEILRDAAHLVLAPRAHLGAWVVVLVFACLLGALQIGARPVRA